jgi:hypothetical protein
LKERDWDPEKSNEKRGDNEEFKAPPPIMDNCRALPSWQDHKND